MSILAFVLAVFLASTANAQSSKDTTYGRSGCAVIDLPSHADRIDSLVVTRMRAERIPAVQISLLENGRIESRAYGYADLQHCVFADTNSVFGLGSVSKQLTAYATLRAVQAGKIGLDDAITKYLPEAAQFWNGITIHHLLTHTSGIRDYAGDDPMHPQISIDSRAEYTADSLLKILAVAPMNFRPGVEFAYSNTGYKILSIILERAVGKPFPEVMRTLVYQPLSMNSTISWDPNVIVPNLANGYTISHGQLMNGRYSSENAGRYGGDFRLLTTASDMARFARELIHPAHISADLLALMKSRTVLLDGASVAYGFGIRPSDVRGVPSLNHGGTWSGGYTAFDEIFPTHDFAVVILTNSWDAQPWNLGAAIMRIADDSIPTIPEAAADPNPQRTKRILALLGGDSTAMPMAPAFARHQYAFVTKETTEMISHRRAFSFRGCDDLRRSKASLPPLARSECYYEIDMGDGVTITLAIYFTASDAIADIQPVL
ncbi:MAG: serine hydrolase domain-containing protein [Gemmatimonadaceae bacterium]